MTERLSDFRAELLREDRAENTVASYIRDLELFARWFEQTNGEEFDLGAVTPLDVKDCRRFLLVSQGARPATVNRRLAALRKLFRWACGKGLVDDDPTEQVNGVGEGRRLNRHRTEKKSGHTGVWEAMKETAEYALAGAVRYKVERKFGEGKEGHGLRRRRYVGIVRYQLQVVMTAVTLNLKRIVRLTMGVPIKGTAVAG